MYDRSQPQIPPQVAGPAETVPHVSFVLAALNEAKSLPSLLETLDTLSLPSWEAVVIDDGSTDGTREFLQLKSHTDPRVRPLFNPAPQTLTKAQWQGVAAARAPVLVVMDTDLQHDPTIIPNLVMEIDQGHSLAIGSRYGDGASAGPRTMYRTMVSIIAEVIAKLMIPAARDRKDPLSGFFAFRRDAFWSFTPQHGGYKLLLYLLVARRSGDIVEVPYEFGCRKYGDSKITRGLGFVRLYLSELLSIRRLSREISANHLHDFPVAGSGSPTQGFEQTPDPSCDRNSATPACGVLRSPVDPEESSKDLSASGVQGKMLSHPR